MHSNRLLHWSKILPSSFSGPHQEVRKGELMEKERKKGRREGEVKGREWEMEMEKEEGVREGEREKSKTSI